MEKCFGLPLEAFSSNVRQCLKGVAEGERRRTCLKWVEDTGGNAWRCCPICWLLRVAPGGRVEEGAGKGCQLGLRSGLPVGCSTKRSCLSLFKQSSSSSSISRRRVQSTTKASGGRKGWGLGGSRAAAAEGAGAQFVLSVVCNRFACCAAHCLIVNHFLCHCVCVCEYTRISLFDCHTL